MIQIRQPAVAGMFYPEDPAELHAMISGYLRDVPVAGETPKAIIAPHAGYIYSGSIAATAYALLQADRDVIERIVLLGPSHRVPFGGLALSSAAAFTTPFGEIPVDREAVGQIAHLPGVQILDQAHAYEHSLEVHLPFLQEVLGSFRLVPVVVGDTTADEVANVLEALWGGPETRFVISSDLSHYHEYESARRLDYATSRAIEALRGDQIGYEEACGRNPINGLLFLARKRGLKARTLDLRNSGDTAGPKDRVVGYGAYAFSEREAASH